MVDGDRVGRAQGIGFGTGHGRQVQTLHDLRQHRHAEQSFPVGDKEVDGFGGQQVGRADEVAFVLAVFRVEDDDGFAAAEGGQGRIDGGKISNHAVVGNPAIFQDGPARARMSLESPGAGAA